MKNFEVYHLYEKTAYVQIGDNAVHIDRYVIHPVKQIFPKDDMTRYEFGNVLAQRCWDPKRANIGKYLEKLGLDSFDVYKICEKTHGVRLTDYIWFKFDGENISADDVLVLKHE